MTRGSRARSAATPSLPKAVFFDLDDTIFDHSLTCRAALARLRRREPLFRVLTLDALWHEYSRLLEDVQPDVLAGRRTVQEARVERFRRLVGLCGQEISEVTATEFSQRYRANYQRLRRTVPGVRRVLERLHGRTVIGIVTNNEVPEQEEKLDHFGLRSLVDFMVVSQGVGVAKPDPEIFRLALAKAGTRPDETVMVGDSWKSDVTGARNSGIHPVWFNRFHLARPDPWPVRELESFRSPARTEAVLAETFRQGPAGRQVPPARIISGPPMTGR